MAHKIVEDVVTRLNKAADAALAIMDGPLTSDIEISAASTRVRAANAVTNASSVNIRARLAAPKLLEIESAAPQAA
jgi:hypothetical protein